MALMPPIPVSRYLVPETPTPLPDTFTTVTIPLTSGLPFTFRLDAHWSLNVSYPTGVLQPWIDADPSTVTSADTPERAPFDPTASPSPRDPVRIAVVRDGTRYATIPLNASRRALIVDDGANPAALELAILSWTIDAGAVIGGTATTSSLSVAWRDATLAVPIFGTPPLKFIIALRLPRLVTPAFIFKPMLSETATIVDHELVAQGTAVARREVGWQ